MMLVTSCTKTKTSSSSNDAAKFVGTWTGTSCGSATSFTLAAGSNGSSLTNVGTVGDAACLKSVTTNFTVSGNNITVPTQTYVDNCGNSYTISGSGSLSGNTLTLTETVSGTFNLTCTFVGTK